MPALRITKNETHFCTVGSDDVWMLSAGVWGDLWGPEASWVDVHGGGKRKEDGSSDFIIWQTPNELFKGDRIAFFFEETACSDPKGMVFNPSTEEETTEIDFTSPLPAEQMAELAARPPLNAGMSWFFKANDDPAIALSPDNARQHIRLSVLWNEERPQRVRVSVSKKSLQEISERQAGEEIFLEYLPLGSHFEITLGH